MDDPVPRSEKNKWFKELLDTQAEIAAKRTASMNGKTYRVLVESEGKSEGTLSGRTDENVIIEFEGGKELIGKMVNVKCNECKGFYYFGELAD